MYFVTLTGFNPLPHDTVNEVKWTVHVLPSVVGVSASVTLDYPDGGGHTGFASGPFPGNLDWLPGRLLDFFTEKIPAPH